MTEETGKEMTGRWYRWQCLVLDQGRCLLRAAEFGIAGPTQQQVDMALGGYYGA